MSTRTKEYILTESGNHISRLGLNLINTQSIVLGGKCILEPHVTIRGDLGRSTGNIGGATTTTRTGNGTGADGGAAVVLGRYCLLRSHVSLVPPHKTHGHSSSSSTSTRHDPSTGPRPTTTTTTTPPAAVGEGNGTTEQRDDSKRVYYPLKMGDYVHIGAGSRVEAASIASYVHIGSDCHIGNMSIIKEGSVVEDGTVLAPYSVVAPLSRVRGRPGLVVGECPEVTIDVVRDRMREHYARVVGAK